MAWTPMPKIPRYYRDIVITEKLDGTNGAIEVTDEGEVRAYSKNRLLVPGHKLTDNFGFAGWVERNATNLFLALGHGVHRGEWFGLGINRGYDLYERRFALFNTARHTGPFLTPGLTVVPVLYEGPHQELAIENVFVRLAAQGSEAVPGFMRPEGIVIYHKASGHLYKVTLENDEEPKQFEEQRRVQAAL